MRGPATLSVLYSDKFLTRIAKDIIDNCSSISMVTFGEYGTDHIATYGLFKNSKVVAFECVDPLTIKTVWGQTGCI